ncbi:universal stress protein [Blastococcus sp. URHD0036]|uniref:universal stress protein n=1 Tax=Blastococcus sp. URHD0036 TaxID=1380356 RepID=UPI000691449B|nr:universal stress protein [Blastococcus sp. URHD0036]
METTTSHTEMPDPGSTDRRPVVVAFDGSAPARRAAHWAADEAARSGRALRLVHALRWPLPELAGLGLPDAALDVDRARLAASAEIHVTLMRCGEQVPGLDVSGEVLEGDAGEVLTKAAADASLLVLGASGQTAVPTVLLGSTAAELVRTVTTPVAVVRDHPGMDGRGPVVIGVDGSPASRAAVRLGFELAGRHGRDVVAVHTWSDIPLAALAGRVDLERGALEERATAFLAGCLAEVGHRHREIRVHPVTRADRPARALLELATEAAVIVVGRHGRAGSAAPLGSVSHAIAHYAPCPVIVVDG